MAQRVRAQTLHEGGPSSTPGLSRTLEHHYKWLVNAANCGPEIKTKTKIKETGDEAQWFNIYFAHVKVSM